MSDTNRLVIKIGIVILAVFLCLIGHPTGWEFAIIFAIVLAILFLWRGEKPKQ